MTGSIILKIISRFLSAQLFLYMSLSLVGAVGGASARNGKVWGRSHLHLIWIISAGTVAVCRLLCAPFLSLDVHLC